MKTLFLSLTATLLLASDLNAQRDASRQNTAPLGTSVFIRDLDANKRADGLALPEQDVELTETFQQHFTVRGTSGAPILIAFRAYPNPVVNNLWLEVAGPELDFYVTLYNQSGQALGLVNRNVAGSGRWEENFNLNALPAGTYILAFSDADGNRLVTQRIIKQN